MRGLVIFLLIVLVISSFIVVANINNDRINDNKKSEELKFSTFTSAVCENKERFVYCKDEVFVNCNGQISKAIDIAECNGIRLDVPEITGFAVFEKEWEDPRE